MKHTLICHWCGQEGAAKTYCDGKKAKGVKRPYHRKCRRERCAQVRAERQAKREASV